MGTTLELFARGRFLGEPRLQGRGSCEPEASLPQGRWDLIKELHGLIVLGTICVPGILAQQFGEITGTLNDASGAVLVGAAVTATNTGTQAVRATASNHTGNYAEPAAGRL